MYSLFVAYWNYREQWPEYISSGFTQTSSVREAYLARHTAVQQFKFVDPLVADLYTEAKPFNHLFLNKNDIIFSQVLNLLSVTMFLVFECDGILVSWWQHGTFLRLDASIISSNSFRPMSLTYISSLL